MLTLPKPDVILTHESDLDGFVSGLLLQRLAKRLFGLQVRLEAYHYHSWKQRELREASAWVCDFNFDARLDKPNWLVVDHHTTTVKPQHSLLVHDLNKSAGLLCYELCRENGLGSAELDRLAHLNNVGDLFLENDPDFILANDYCNLVKTYQFWNLHAIIDGTMERLIDHPLLEVMAVKRRLEDPIGFEWSRKNLVEITPSVGFVETIVGNSNMIVHQLLESKATPYTVLVTLLRKSNNVIVASLRSRGGEALKIAEKLQGGGHPNACGATLPRAVKNVPDALDYMRRVFDTSPRRDEPLNNSLEGLFAQIGLK